MSPRPVALVTGASRTIGIRASIALALAGSGWDVERGLTTGCNRHAARAAEPDR